MKNMKTLKSLKDQYGTYSKMSIEIGIHQTQIKRLIAKGALYNEKGEIFIPSKSKIKLS